MKIKNTTKAFFSIILICFITLLSSCKGAGTVPAGELSSAIMSGYAVVQFLDVGQADCSLISLPDGRHILIDAGNEEDGDLIVDYLKNSGISKIDYIIGTHPHEDHIGGLDEVINSFTVGKIILPRIDESDITGTIVYEEVLLAAKESRREVLRGFAGLELIKDENVTLTCVAPNKDNYSSLNDYSVVLLFSYGETEILFTGDAEVKSEKEILAADFDISADILKVGHHGSKTATSDAFLKKVNPEYAVISVGEDNIYTLPDEEVIDKLSDISVLRTDEKGSIFFVLNTQEIVNQYCSETVCLDGN